MAETMGKNDASTQMQSTDFEQSKFVKNYLDLQKEENKIHALDTSLNTSIDSVKNPNSKDNFKTGTTGASIDSFDIEIKK